MQHGLYATAAERPQQDVQLITSCNRTSHCMTHLTSHCLNGLMQVDLQYAIRWASPGSCSAAGEAALTMVGRNSGEELRGAGALLDGSALLASVKL